MQFAEAVQDKKTQQDSFGEEEWMNGEDWQRCIYFRRW